MTKHRIQSFRSLEREMKAVARGEPGEPAEAAQVSFDSLEALARILTPANRRLLALIRDRRPASIAELARITGRAAPNLTRTLSKLESAGLVEMKKVNRRKVPTVRVRKLLVEIDPYSEEDRLELT